MDVKEKRELFLGAAGVVWLLAVLLGYAYTHKPFTPEQVFVLMQAFWQIAVVFGILSLAGGLGYRLFKLPAEENLLVALTVQTALGFGVLALAIFLLGITLGFSLLFLVFFYLAGMILLYKDSLSWWRQWRAFLSLLAESGKFERVLAAGVFFILFVTFAKSLAPPLAFDSLVYHLTLPKWYLMQGWLAYTPDLMYWGMPQNAEMLYLLAMGFGGAEAAALLGWTFGLLTLGGILGFVRTHFSPLAAWVGLVVLLTGYSLAISLSWAYVEWLLMLYGFGVFVLLFLWVERGERRFLLWTGVLLGFAVGTKYTAAVLPMAVLLVLFWQIRREPMSLRFVDAALFVGSALLIFLPWLIKNWLAVGNPFYPFLFPAGAMDETRLALHQGHSAWGDWRDIVLLPWRATIWGIKGKIGYSAEIGALLLGLSVFYRFGWKERDKTQKIILRIALLISLGVFILWGLAGRVSLLLLQSRLYFIFFPIWAVLAATGFEQFYTVKAKNIRFGRLAGVLVLLSFGFTLFEFAVDFSRNGVSKYLLGIQNASTYRTQVLGTYETAMSSIRELPPDASVVMLWETRGFSCVPQCEPDETIDRWYLDFLRYGSVEAVEHAWKKAGYTHILLYKDGADFVRKEEETPIDWAALNELLATLPLQADFGGSYQLYTLLP